MGEAGLIDGLIGAWLGPAVLVTARVAGLAATAPGWGAPGLGWRLRAGLTGLVAAVVVPVVGAEVEAPSGVALGSWALAEAALGAGLGLVLGMVVAGARQAGELIGAQAGLSAAALFDPEAGGEATAAGHLYGMLAMGAFLAVGGPLRLVGAVIESYRALPCGGVALTEETVGDAFGRVGWALGLALRAAAPVAVSLVVAGLVLGMLSRVGGALQVAGLAWPARSLIGVGLMLLGLGGVVGLLVETWRAVLGL